MALDKGLVRRSGSWFSLGDDQLGQGRENVKQFLCENPEVAMQLQAKIYEKVGFGMPGLDADREVRAVLDAMEGATSAR